MKIMKKITVAMATTIAFATGASAADPITVVSWGGSYGKAQDSALFNDASKNSGIAINRESGASMSKTCLQVEVRYIYHIVVYFFQTPLGCCCCCTTRTGHDQIPGNCSRFNLKTSFRHTCT